MDIRREIYGQVAGIAALDALEEAHKADVLGWIESGVEVFRLAKPATPPKHLVAYFMVVDGEHVLLVDHIKAQLWLPSGGHVEPQEHPRDTVAREIVEELGMEAEFVQEAPLMVTVTETVGLTAGHTDVSLWYVVKGDRRRAVEFDRGEFTEVRWFHWDEIPYGRSDPHMRRFIEKLRVILTA